MPSDLTRGATTADSRHQFQHALALHRTGHATQAEALCEKLIRAEPRHYEALHLLGVIAHQTGNHLKAVDLIDKAITVFPTNANFYSNQGNALAALGRFDAAIANYDQALALRADLAEVHYNRAGALQKTQQPAAAIDSYDRAIALRPDLAEAHYGRAIALQDLKQLAAAVASYDRTLALQPDFAAAHYDRANALAELEQHEAAVAGYDRVIALAPDFAEAYYNRGNALYEIEQRAAAVASYDRAIALKPGFALAHYNRGNSLSALGRFEEAAASYARALEFEPEHTEAKRCIFWLHFAELKNPALVDQLSEELSAANTKKEFAKLLVKKQMPEFRVLHDLEQTSYLLALGYDSDGLREANRTLQDAYTRYRRDPGPFEGKKVVPFFEEELADIYRFRKNAPRYRAAAPIDHYLNPDNDWAAIEQQYLANDPQIIAIDNLLSPDALRELRAFCQVSAIWKKEYVSRYLATFAEDFFSPLHFQIAAELKRRMPAIFGSYPLEHMWAFKYDSRMVTGVNIHADYARVNLNFWITPDAANLDPASGGLVVYHVPAPTTWRAREYNNEKNRSGIYAFLEQNGAGRTKIPYKCNRAVLFNSNLFHETDELHFAEGYENRRINVTYLFGRGLKKEW